MPKHAKSNRRLQRAAVLSTAALVLPVLGTVATPAYAEDAAAGTTQSASANNSQGAENRNERATEQQETGPAKSSASKNDDQTESAGRSEDKRAAQSQERGAQPQQQQQAAPPKKSEPAQAAPKSTSPAEDKGPERVGDNNANAQGNGANTDGPFNSRETETKDEGKQVQGSRGKADDKNPPGQVGNTRDSGYECDDNSGIGDGPNDPPGSKKPNSDTGNPAHTGCDDTAEPPQQQPEENPRQDDEEQEQPETPGTPVEESNVDEDEDEDVDDNDTTAPGTTPPADTVTPPVNTPPAPVQQPTEVLNETITAPQTDVGTAVPAVEAQAVLPRRTAAVSPAQVSAFSPSALPFTGAESGVLALVALASLAVGGGMIVVARRVPA